ncbi:hypothetical protein EAE96_006906 [Botrytis aclada]|nr:hypothetical protein EAE96_006906 [Botrytis aclada]
MIRRTYASPDHRFPQLKIAENIAALHKRRIFCKFEPEEFKVYQSLSNDSYRKLYMVSDSGVVTWNRKSEEGPVHPLYTLVTKLHEAMDAKHPAPFDLPNEYDIPAQLAIICRGSPKLRSFLRMVAELVVLNRKKIVVWCALPATQLFLHTALKSLGITTACFTSELDLDARNRLVNSFHDVDGASVEKIIGQNQVLILRTQGVVTALTTIPDPHPASIPRFTAKVTDTYMKHSRNQGLEMCKLAFTMKELGRRCRM